MAYDKKEANLFDSFAELLSLCLVQLPHAALLGGDIVDGVLPEENAWITVRALAGTYPCVYVTGNHEWWSGETERICEQMTALGVTVLRGDGVTWDLNGLYAPHQGLFPKYAGGRYDFDGTTFLVSRGLARESTKCCLTILRRS